MYRIEMAIYGVWQAIPGSYRTESEAAEKVAQYRLCGSKKAPKAFRIVRCDMK